MQANYGETEIKNLLQKLRIFNKDIGQYELFAITGEFDYAVKLSNGKILLKLEELQSDEHDALTVSDLEKIANRFVSSEPKIAQPNVSVSNQTAQIKKASAGFFSTWYGVTISTLAVVFIIGIIGSLVERYNTIPVHDDYTKEATYEEVEMTLEEKERSEPTKFLNASGTYRKNFWGNKLKIACEITNSAKLVTYKDAVVRVTYYAASGTVLEETDFTIFELFPPGETITNELKVPNYSNVKTITYEVVNAKIY